MQREWVAQEGMLPCLSIQQPFAQAILLGRKSIELRTWRTQYRGWLALHAGKKFFESWSIDSLITAFGMSQDRATYPLGAVVGLARLIKCANFTYEGFERLREQHGSDVEWDSKIVGWQFADVHMLPEPVPMRGQLGLFPVARSLFPDAWMEEA